MHTFLQLAIVTDYLPILAIENIGLEISVTIHVSKLNKSTYAIKPSTYK